MTRLILIGTGGTIASTAADARGLTDYRVTEGIGAMLAAIPGATDLADIRCEQLCNVDSRALTTAQILKLARAVNRHVQDASVDGVVITHGTDSLEETAFFLHLTIDSAKPVVLVGAMRPASAISADGPLNLLNALHVACDPESRGRGVLVVLNDRIVAARSTLKLQTTHVDAFGADGIGVIGTLCDGAAHYDAHPDRPPRTFGLTGLHALPRVPILYDYQDAPLFPYQAAIDAGVQGLVVAGLGNGSLSPAAERGCRQAQRHGVVCVRASRVPRGRVTYAASDGRLGFLASGRLNPLQTRIALRLALASNETPQTIQQLLDKL